MKARKKVIQGGTSAGKTFAILAVLIDKAARTPGLEISVVSETLPHLRKGAMKDFIKLMKETVRWIESNWNTTLSTYRFTNGSYIEFFPVTDQRGARRNILYVNECDNITFEQYHQLAVRTSGDIYLCYNPATEFWVHTEVMKEPDVEVLVLTYLDNEGCPDNVKADFEIARKKAETSKWWENWCKVYIDGQLGITEGIVYKDWQIIDTIPIAATLLGSGIDFGFSNDPTAVVDLYKYNDGYILDERLYQTGLLPRDLYNSISKIKTRYVGDKSSAMAIEELRRYGLSIMPSYGGSKGEIKYGVSLLQQNKISITSRSVNGIKEMRKYCWDQDRYGNNTSDPIDEFNHFMDAARYIAMVFMNKPTGGIRIGGFKS